MLSSEPGKDLSGKRAEERYTDRGDLIPKTIVASIAALSGTLPGKP